MTGVTVSEAQTVRATALETLRNNRRWVPLADGTRLRFTCPSPGRYSFQWFWDSAFHAIALAHLEPDAAREELQLLSRAQQPDGFMPHVVFWDRRLLLRAQHYWCWLQSRGRGLPRTTALMQPPVVAAALERYAEVTGDVSLVRLLLPKLDAYFSWLQRARDPEGDGLITIIAPWESGMDHKPSYDAGLGLGYPAPARLLAIAPRVVDIANRTAGYRADLVVRGRFRVDDVFVNAVYVDGMRSLARLHRMTGGGGSSWEQQASRSERALIAAHRGPDGFFYDVDRRTRRQLPGRTIGGLAALLLDGLSGPEAAPLLDSLTSPSGFATPFPAPSTAASEPSFTPGGLWWKAAPLIWRGPVSINTNWLLVRALRRREQHKLADAIVRASVALVLRSGYREFYHPYTGAGLGARSFGWSTLVVDMLMHR